MAEALTLEELTKLVRERMRARGFGDVRFVIRPLPFEFRNWDIVPHHPVPLRGDQRTALQAVCCELGEEHYLNLSNLPSPYAA
jgi:hypothetical protein